MIPVEHLKDGGLGVPLNSLGLVIQRLYHQLYRFKNLAFKAPKQSTKYPNLFFVGGSVNPGGGMPMVVLCGQNVAKKIVAWDRN